MKILSKIQVCFLFLFCVMWQNTHSQLLYQDDKKGEYLPPYNPDVVLVSQNVEKWTKEQIANKDANKKTVKMKTDILGRAKSSQDEIGDGKVFVVENKQKRLVVVSDMHIPQIEMEPMSGRYEYNPEAKSHRYYLNGKEINAKEYDNSMEKHYEKFYSQNKGKRNLLIPGVIKSDTRSWTALMTAEEISELTKKYKEISIYDYMEPIEEAPVADILRRIQISTHAFPNGYEGYGVGVYVMEPGCRDTSIPLYRSSRYTNNCTGSTSTHHSRVVNVVQHAAPLAHVFGFGYSATIYPNPSSYFPPLEIGTHSYGYSPGLPAGNLYNDYDMNMDNHIYTSRIINFKSAGNNSGTGDYISSPGKALNIITVGAVDPANDNYAYYSSRKNSDIGNEKPEVAMYTDIDMGSYGFINGTSAAAPLAAGFTATLLDQHPFFKRQPALTKAVLITGETIPVKNASSWDSDNWRSAQKIMTYSSVAWGTRSAWWSGGNSAHFDSKNEIKFTENNIRANKQYRIAIAVLAPGSYINANRVPPQDIDLRVEQNGRTIASSTSARNPFEVVDFTTTSSDPLTIVIYRYSNSGTGDVLLGYHMRDNF